MSLLDEDAKELKKQAVGDKPSTGRKANQSGLGAFKGLSKYANLTAKYRTTAQENSPSTSPSGKENPTVEHGRGTNNSPTPITSQNIGHQTVTEMVINKLPNDNTSEKKEPAKRSPDLESIGHQKVTEVSTVSSPNGDQLVIKCEQILETPLEKTVTTTEVSSPNNGNQIVTKTSSNGYQTVTKVDHQSFNIGHQTVTTHEPQKSPNGYRPDTVSLNNGDQSVINRIPNGHQNTEGEGGHPLRSTLVEKVTPTSTGAFQDMPAQTQGPKAYVAEAIGSTLPSIQGPSEGESLATIFKAPPVTAAELKIPKTSETTQIDAPVYRDQMVTKESPKTVPIGHQRVTSEEFAPSSVTKRVTERSPSESPMSYQTDTDWSPLVPFSQLVGLQRQLTLFVFESCKQNRTRTSGPLSLENLALDLQSTRGAVKQAAYRLREKEVIRKGAQKEGRGGFTQYVLANAIYQEILMHEGVTNRVSNGHQLVSDWSLKRVSERLPDPSSSSSFKNNIKTTTDENPNYLPPEWEVIDYTCLARLNFGRSHLVVLRKETSLSAEQVQTSIKMFHHDLMTDTGKRWKNPLGVLMKCLRVQQQPWTSGTYVSEEDKILDAHFAQIAHREAERKDKLRQLLAYEYRSWLEKRTFEDLRKIVPKEIEFTMDPDGLAAIDPILKEYFKETHGDEIQQRFLRPPSGPIGNT